MASQRLHRGLVALSASAITAVYLAGYLRTQSADATLGAIAGPEAAAVVTVAPTALPRPGVTATPAPLTRTAPAGSSAPAPAAAAASPAPAGVTAPAVGTPQGAYRDGTYTGSGTSRRGGVVVSVVIEGGRIASVTIASSTLQYPVRDIAGLPALVVQRQSAQVDTVSRATYSSQAFRGAVSQALAKAA